MLYREPDSRRSLRRWLVQRLGWLASVNTRRRRAETDLRELSPYLRHDIGLRDSGYPY